LDNPGELGGHGWKLRVELGWGGGDVEGWEGEGVGCLVCEVTRGEEDEAMCHEQCPLLEVRRVTGALAGRAIHTGPARANAG